MQSHRHAFGLTIFLNDDGVRLAPPDHMVVKRIVELADGEELISFENDRVETVVDDPRRVLLAHRRSAESAADAATRSSHLVQKKTSVRRSKSIEPQTERIGSYPG